MICKYQKKIISSGEFMTFAYSVKSIGAVIFVICAFLPVTGLAQSDDSASDQVGAELNISPLDVEGSSGSSQNLGTAQSGDKALPVPNKLGGRNVIQNKGELDESWRDGEALKKRSLLQERSGEKTDGELSREAKLLLSLQRSLQRQEGDEIFASPNISSLFFTADQHALLREARAGFNLRAPSPPQEREGTDASLSDLDLSIDNFGPDPDQGNDGNRKAQQKTRASYIREIVLNGIVYNGPDQWIVWINNERVTPDDKFEQIVDMRVREAFVELRWYDGFSEKIFPIRLRSGQRFNLDTRSFASASGGNAF